MQAHQASADVDAHSRAQFAMPGVVLHGSMMIVTTDGQQRTKTFDRLRPPGIASIGASNLPDLRWLVHQPESPSRRAETPDAWRQPELVVSRQHLATG